MSARRMGHRRSSPPQLSRGECGTHFLLPVEPHGALRALGRVHMAGDAAADLWGHGAPDPKNEPRPPSEGASEPTERQRGSAQNQ